MVKLNSSESYIKIRESIDALDGGMVVFFDNEPQIVIGSFVEDMNSEAKRLKFVADCVPDILDLYKSFQLFSKNNQCRSCGKTVYIATRRKMQMIIDNFMEKYYD